MPAPGGPITVSTLKEAEQFFAHGVTDILYAVGIAPGKLAHVADLRARGCDLSVILDSVEAAAGVSAYCRATRLPDPRAHRDRLRRPPRRREARTSRTCSPSPARCAGGAALRGVMTHAGALVRLPLDRGHRRDGRAGARGGRQRGRARCAPPACRRPVVSVGSTPTATFARDLPGVTEVRAGVFVFQDLVMAGLGVCAVDDIALSVLVSVIGHQREKGWILTDGGWMAVSRDRGTATQPVDQGYGLVLRRRRPPAGRAWSMTDANQEHGIVSRRDGGTIDWPRFADRHAAAHPAQPRLRHRRAARRVRRRIRGSTRTWYRPLAALRRLVGVRRRLGADVSAPRRDTAWPPL